MNFNPDSFGSDDDILSSLKQNGEAPNPNNLRDESVDMFSDGLKFDP